MLDTIVSALLAAGAAFSPTLNQQQNVDVSFGAASVSQQPKVLSGVLSEPLTGELNQAVTDWANANKALLGLPSQVVLRKGEAFGTRFGASFHLVQTVGGVDVHLGETVVTLDEQARVSLVSQTPIAFSAVKPQWTVSGKQALRTAAEKVRFVPVMSDGTPYGGIRGELFFVRGELHSGWWLYLPQIDAVHSYYAAVDATSGELLFVEDKSVHSALSAQVYTSSPGGLDAGVGVTGTIDVELLHEDGGSMVLAGVDGGYLSGDRLTAYNCCVNQDCVASTDPDAGARAQGTLMFMGFPIQYDTSICQRLQRASNDPATHASGDYVYPPLDPPALVNGQPGPVSQSDPADVDEFAEVHAFYHVNQIYDWETRLSQGAAAIYPGNQPAITPFKMRDERKTPARVPAVWSNVTFPDLQSVNIACLQNPPCVINGLMRIDNAAFMPVEGFAQLLLPAYMMDVDTLLIFQGNLADFGYDAPVLWHESGHGVVYSTAGLDPGASLAIDSRSANNEAAAMHEGLADYTAAAFGNDPRIGVYVGPRISGAGGGMLPQDVALRDLSNTNFACPDVLWGEAHQDSQHFSAALWQARTTTFAGTDNGATFDAVVYATLVSMTPKESFKSVAAILSAHLPAAFPNVAGGADVAMNGIFDSKGVTNCSKVLDVTNVTTPRPYFGISDPAIQMLTNTLLPGPIQFKIHAPNGISTVKVSGTPPQGGLPFGGGTSASILAKVGAPITFVLTGSNLSNDALPAVAMAGTAPLTGTATVDVPCGGDLYFTLAADQGATLQNVTWQVTPPASCNPTDGGTGGGAGGGGGTSTGGGAGGGGGTSTGGGSGGVVNIPWVGPTTDGKNAGGCGCGSTDGALVAVAGLLLLALRRRR